MGITYEILTDSAGNAEAIKCLQCGRTSYHPKDVEHRYCAHCHLFHDDLRRYAKQMPPYHADVGFQLWTPQPDGDVKVDFTKSRVQPSPQTFWLDLSGKILTPEKVAENLVDIEKVKDRGKP